MQRYSVPRGTTIAADDAGEIYLASDVDSYRNTSCDIIGANGRELTRMVARINELEKALREVGEHRCGECYECAVVINKAIGLMGT